MQRFPLGRLYASPPSDLAQAAGTRPQNALRAASWLRLAAAVRLSIAAVSHASAQTWTNTSLPPSQRAGALVAAMTQAEKQTLLSGIYGSTIGYISGNSRLGIPAITFQDGPAGSGDSNTGVTAFPCPLCLAATFDVNAARTYGTYVGAEERGKGGSVILGPTMNIGRNYTDGRAFEAYGEDPFLAGVVAAADIEGIQSNGVLADAKHFVLNDQETNRWFESSDASERTREEIYEPPFRACVNGGVAVIMAAYNRINGRYACESPDLNATIKKMWGYDGWIMSDWAAFFGTATAADNGLDMDMYNGAYGSNTPLLPDVAAGVIPQSEIDEKAHRILEAMFRFGLFDNPSTGNVNAYVETPAHSQFARDCAAAGTVLLKNQGGLLPLNVNTVGSIAVIGSLASAGAFSTGFGSANVVLPYNITPLAGIQSRAGSGVTVTYSVGDGDIPDAVTAAQAANVAVVCVGQRTQEGTDRTSLSLPDDQDALVAAVAAANPRTIVVLYNSSSTLMPWVNSTAADLAAWFPGQENGNALAEILFGDVNPSGRLPVTFPAAANQIPANTPAQYPGIGGQVSYSEGLDIGYRWYDANNVAPLFAFGHGLSYTSFSYSNLVISPVSASGQATLSFNVTNSGQLAGAEVPQLYLGFPAVAGEPPKLLKGFAKITLAAGQTQQVTFPLDWIDLAYWDTTARGWIVPQGTYTVSVGASSRDIRLTGSLSAGPIPSSDVANAALHQVATGSSGTPSLAVDGVPTTAWTSSTANSQTFQVDLGVIKDLSRVRLQWGADFASAYTIQSSPDGSNWTTIHTTTAGVGGIEDLLVSGRGRYIQLITAQPGVAGAGYTLNEFEVYAQPQRPYGGTVTVLPGRVEAENYDTGGEGVAYSNTDVGNKGGADRTDDVGVEPCADVGGGYDVGWINTGEWLEYTVNPPDAEAIYSVNVRVASPNSTGLLRVRLNGTVLGTVSVPNTGSYQTWQTVTLPNVPIAGGTGSQALRLEVLGAGFNLNWVELDRAQVCSTTDYAQGQPAYASSSAGSGNPGSDATDGSSLTNWLSQSGDPQWLMVDLGSVLNVARVVLDWDVEDWENTYGGYGEAAYSQAYNIQFSLDGNNWTTEYSTASGVGSISDLALAGNARFVRVNSTQEVNPDGVGLFSLEVYPGFPVVSTPSAVANINSSFEYQTVADGTFVLGDPTFWSSEFTGSCMDAVINPGGAGTYEPWGSTNPAGLDGSNFCQIFAEAAGDSGLVYQDTGIKFQAGATYQLTAAFGLQTNQTFAAGSTMGFYNSSLAPVAATSGITVSQLTSNAFKDISLTYTATGAEGGDGDIIVGFYSPPASAGSTYFDFDNVRLVTVPTSFAAYQQQYFTAAQLQKASISGPSADANGDGISNLEACALGLSPWVNAASSLPAAVAQNGYLTITYPAPKAATAWTVTVQVSSDMVHWYSGAGYTTQTSVTSLDAARNLVTVTDNTPISANSKRFMRLNVTLP